MLGEKIKELREARGITQEELAVAMSLSRPTITKYETGERTPDLITATRVAEFFGISLDHLVGHKPSVKEKLAYEIVAMFDRKGLTPDNIESSEFKRLLAVVNYILDTYVRDKRTIT
jgi:transcriptional regulator with XRE-family HTH domain